MLQQGRKSAGEAVAAAQTLYKGVPEMRGRWGGEKRIRRQSQGVRYRQLQSKDRKERQFIRRVSRSWRYTITDYRPILTATAAMAELGGYSALAGG
ncbi:hypothetical protein IG631_03961 [Alternaria alternata]|nr:hypothetical protein IG631_03961 [Alternaria alternata]